MFIIDLIIFILVLGVIILIHELGHFYFAKKAGILCHEFSIGMGPAIYQKRKGETIYSIRGIPIGGYVSMAGESVNDALIKKEQVIGVLVNEQGQIYQINLNGELKSDQTGIVKSYDLYGKDFNPLFITLEVDGEVQSYPVLRDTVYKINEERELWITPAEKSFESKTLWQRFLVIFAGPFMNFLLALLIYLIVGFFLFKPTLSSSEIGEVGLGTPVLTMGLEAGDVITSINGNPIADWHDLSKEMARINSTHMQLTYQRDGITYTLENIPVIIYVQMAGFSNTFISEDQQGNVVYNIYNDEPIIGTVFGRAKKGDELKQGDLIKQITVGSQNYFISSWNDVIDVFQNHRSGTIKITYERLENGQTNTRTKTYDLISENVLSKLGATAMVYQMGVTPTSSFDFLYSLKYPFTAFYGNMRSVIVTIGLLFTPSANLGIGDLSGPIGIFSLVSSTASMGLLPLLSFTAFLSINIGMLNLLPIPALDGGRLVFLGYEAITRRPLNKKFENTVNNIMFILLLILFVYVAFNDIFG